MAGTISNEELQQSLKDLGDNLNGFFLCSNAIIIFLMQAGFAFLEAGSVRSKNATNILIKNLLDSCISVIGYWAIGWALAYGTADNETVGLFIGHKQFFLIGLDDWPKFFFQYVFAATTATIILGAVAERCEFICYIVYCAVISTFVYPILTHWAWQQQGWMFKGITVQGSNVAYLDFAGAGVVHLCGGTISLVAAYLMGPRIGRFSNDAATKLELKGHSVPLVALGGFILMFGFLAFNGGSVGTITATGAGAQYARAISNTMLTCGWAGMAFLAIYYYRTKKWNLTQTINACLTGMVTACAGCNRMDPWGASLSGIGAAVTYMALSAAVLRLKIDDPLDAVAVHAGGGFWGLFSICFFGEIGLINTLFYRNSMTVWLAQFGFQLACIATIIVWSLVTMYPVFMLLKKIGKFRVSQEVEMGGLDFHRHGEIAYPKQSVIFPAVVNGSGLSEPLEPLPKNRTSTDDESA